MRSVSSGHAEGRAGQARARASPSPFLGVAKRDRFRGCSGLSRSPSFPATGRMSGPPSPAGFGVYGVWIVRISCDSHVMRESSPDPARPNRVAATRCFCRLFRREQLKVAVSRASPASGRIAQCDETTWDPLGLCRGLPENLSRTRPPSAARIVVRSKDPMLVGATAQP